MDVSAGVERMTIIADFDTENKLAKKSPDQNTVARQFLGFLQNHYPERLAKAIALNPPWYIRLLFTLISPFMDPVTKKKIHFLNGDAAYVKKELLQYIDEDQLESCYGGTRPVEPEPDCRHARQEREAQAASSSAAPSSSADTETPKQKKKKKSKPVEEEPAAEPSSSTTAEVEVPTADAPEEEEELTPTPKKKKSKKSVQPDSLSVGKEAVVEVE